MTGTDQLELYGLLHLERDEKTAVNARTTHFDDQVRLYARSAVGLSRSLARQGVRFTLVTNDVAGVRTATGGADDLRVIEIPFTTDVPSGIRFYSAHFKLDMFRYLATRTASTVGLVDVDAVCVRPVPVEWTAALASGSTLYYDISDQVFPAYGRDTVLDDVRRISGVNDPTWWAGGELLVGAPSFFAALCREVDAVWPTYLELLPGLHHVGDEAVTTAALVRLERAGTPLLDAAAVHGVARWWSCAVDHDQPPFEALDDVLLLHLPADKEFLAEVAGAWCDPEWQFRPAYRGHLRSPGTRARRAAQRLRRALRGR